MRFSRITLRAAPDRLPALAGFYRGLGLDVEPAGRGISFRAGETEIQVVAGSGRPFYHVALLVPGNRFEAARAWAEADAELLPDRETGETVFAFTNWDASACYFNDPADNVVELIAHRGVAESDAKGVFRPTELVGLSELGLVGDPPAMADRLADGLGLELWDGTVAEPGRLAFVGERARTLILSPPGRTWLPTEQAAEPHAVDVVIVGGREAQLELGDRLYRLRSFTA
jgi:hypothetical protein